MRVNESYFHSRSDRQTARFVYSLSLCDSQFLLRRRVNDFLANYTGFFSVYFVIILDMAPTVAVVGLGALGLVTLKNLLEEGFDAVGIERHEYLGGLWHFDERERISVMKSELK